MICGLSKDVNTCPLYIADSGKCGKDSKCLFQESEDKKEEPVRNSYVREPRWYEKYLK